MLFIGWTGSLAPAVFSREDRSVAALRFSQRTGPAFATHLAAARSEKSLNAIRPEAFKYIGAILGLSMGPGEGALIRAREKESGDDLANQAAGRVWVTSASDATAA